MLTWFHPQPAPAEIPERLPSPFAEGMPHPLAQRAAADLGRRLRDGELAPDIDLGSLDQPGRGKMFGVLVVGAPGGRVGYLSAFSGMLGERWLVEGFAPPLFDLAERDTFWPAAEAELRSWEVRLAELDRGPELVSLRARRAEMDVRHRAAASRLRAGHEDRRRIRHEARERLGGSGVGEDALRGELHALGQQSREDEVELRRVAGEHRRERQELDAALQTHEKKRLALEGERAERSRAFWRRIAESYVIPNARGESRTVGSLFAPEPPPGGAGDCAAPKLLAQAFRDRLRPLALAEFWWGAPPLTGERQSGQFYPACQRRCGVVLPYMLEGLDG